MPHDSADRAGREAARDWALVVGLRYFFALNPISSKRRMPTMGYGTREVTNMNFCTRPSYPYEPTAAAVGNWQRKLQ
jgi:hypothetical protein